MTARAIGRVSAFAQLGIIIGPAASGALQFFFGTMGRWLGLGLHADAFARLTFATCGLTAFYVALTSSTPMAMIEENETEVFREQRIAELRATAAKRREERTAKRRHELANPPPMLPMLRQRKLVPLNADDADVEVASVTEDVDSTPMAWLARVVRVARERLTQPSLRLMAMTVGFGLTLSVSTYSLLGDRFFGYGQSQLSAIFSAGAAITILVQLLIFPRLVEAFGKNLTASGGLLALSAGLSGLSFFRLQPFHLIFYLLNRAGSAVADTSTVTLVSRSSANQEQCSRNLGFIQSARALARIISPILCGGLFERSQAMAFAPGGLPYFSASGIALAMAPVPLLLKRPESEEGDEGGEGEIGGEIDATLTFGADAE